MLVGVASSMIPSSTGVKIDAVELANLFANTDRSKLLKTHYEHLSVSFLSFSLAHHPITSSVWFKKDQRRSTTKSLFVEEGEDDLALFPTQKEISKYPTPIWMQTYTLCYRLSVYHIPYTAYSTYTVDAFRAAYEMYKNPFPMRVTIIRCVIVDDDCLP